MPSRTHLPQLAGSFLCAFQGELGGNLKIGMFTFPQPVLFFSDLVKSPNLGRNIIRTFAITFDQRNRRVRFTHG
jgi:hypothetical protein